MIRIAESAKTFWRLMAVPYRLNSTAIHVHRSAIKLNIAG